ncbi:MAG: methionyl-tRNA formyltransferase [Minisyncoccia bacterium]
MRIVFAGTGEFAVPILKTIASQTDWDIILIVSEPAKPAGRRQKLTDSAVAQAARELNLKTTTPAAIKDIKSDLAALNPDVMVVVAYSQILPLEVINIPKFGTVNVHPSLLPKLRGPSPIQATLVQGLTETGVSLMVIDEKVDHGPVISQKAFLVGADETYLTLEPKLAAIGAEMIIHDLPEYVSGQIKPHEQNHTEATFTKLIKKENGRVDWQKMSAEEVYNLWRAYLKWPGVYTFFKNKSGASIRLKLIQIEKCGTSDVQHIRQKQPGEIFTDLSKNLLIACASGAVKITKLQPEGSKILTSAEFLNGYNCIVGQTLT